MNEKIISLGKLLENKRRELNIEIVQVSNYLFIKERDVEAIERDDLVQLDKHLYINGLIRSYAKFLRINPDEIEERIRALPIKSNVENKKHKLVNIGENLDLTPARDDCFNFLFISILLFLVLLSLYNAYRDNDSLITNKYLISEFENIKTEN